MSARAERRAARDRCGSARAWPRRRARGAGAAPTPPPRRRRVGRRSRARRGRATRGSGPAWPSAVGHSSSLRGAPGSGASSSRARYRPPSREWRRAGPGAPAPRPPWARDWPGRTTRNRARWRRRPSGRHRGPPSPSPQYGEAAAWGARPATATIRPLTTGGPMATTPPLHGLRIIECSALGPAAITTRAGGPGSGRDQGGAAGRRLHPRDDVAHRRGHLAHAPPPQPGQALARPRPAHRRRRRHFEGAGDRRRRRDRGHAPGRAGPARRGLRRPARASIPRSSSAPFRATA